VTLPRPTAGNLRDRATGRDEYGVALGLILLTLLASAAGGSTMGQLIAALIASATVVFILRTSNARPREVWSVFTVTIVALALATLAVALGLQDRNPYSFVIAMMAVLGPVAIVRRLISHGSITIQTVLGALCIYLLIGLFYASLYSILGGVSGPFFEQTDTPAPSDFLYFSYITITTVGYGDLTAREAFGQMLAATEALVGQIYLVAGVAILVSNLGRSRGPGEPAQADLVDELRALVDEKDGAPGR
jgi:hypothetical protein